MNTPARSSAAHRRPRGIFVAALFLLLSLPHSSRGQETATVVDDAAAAEAVAGDVTDLGDVVGDAMADITELVDLDSEDVAGAVVDDVDDKAPDAPAAADAAAESTEGATTKTTAATEEATGATEAKEAADAAAVESETQGAQQGAEAAAPVVQSGPYIDLLGDVLLSLEMVDETHAQVHQHYTNEALSGKKVVGLYFSADW